MRGINSIKSTLKKLGAETNTTKTKRSVITCEERDEILRTGIIPDDINKGGWLVVPGMDTESDWDESNHSQKIE